MKVRNFRVLMRQGSGYFGMLGIVSALFLLPISSHALTFTVTNLNDSGNGSLRQAVLDANAAATTDDTIVFQSGLSGIVITSGGFTITGNLTINGPGVGVLTISGNNSQQVFMVDSGVTTTISGLTIKNGGIYNYQGTLTINYCTLSDSTIGGIYNRNGTLTVSNSTLSGNSTTSYGGGIYNRDSTKTLTVSNSTLSGNSARYGGGIYSSGSSGTTIVSNTTLSNNTTSSYTNSSSGGGGLYLYSGIMFVSNSTLSGNSTASYGGGIFNNGTLTVLNSTLSGNLYTGSYTGFGGGGIFNNGALIVLNSTLSSNSAEFGRGGGVYITSGGSSIGNSLIAGNTAFDGTEVYRSSGTFTSQGNNLFGQNGGSGIVNASPIASDIILPGAIGTAIGPLANNGGPTLTHLPVTGSPAINAGNNILTQSASLTTDQRGYDRIQNGTVDIGAVEVSQSSDYNPIHSDFDGNNTDDLAGLAGGGRIYYTLNLGNPWINIPGALDQLVAGDLDGNGKADLAGITSAGKIYYTTNLTTWNNIPGGLNQLVTGNLNGDLYADLAGLTSAGQVYYTTNLTNWVNIPGRLDSLAEH